MKSFTMLLLSYVLLPFIASVNAVTEHTSEKKIGDASSLSHPKKSLQLRAAAQLSSSTTTFSSLEAQEKERELIVGGYQAPAGRFPYYVALYDAFDELQCGGTLIAPDIVLTAAHCVQSNVKYAVAGKYTNVGYDGLERINILNPYTDFNTGDVQSTGKAKLNNGGFLHPMFDKGERKYDIMLMKLATPATNVPTEQLMRINMDPTVPLKVDGGKNEITVIGMGNLDYDYTSPKAESLQQVYVDYVPYEQCVDSQNLYVDYKEELLPHMICTQGAGLYQRRGQCYGDSGGPYIMLGNTPQEDVQVGVVSWAVECSKTEFPMVGSRTSAAVDFIRDVTCAVSVNPPSHLCDANIMVAGHSESFIQTRTDGVPVSVRIYSDPYGHEIKWKITDQFDKTVVYADAPYGRIVGDHTFQTVKLPSGSDLRFEIIDAADDGIFGSPDAIMYEIVLLDENGQEEIVIAEGNGQFTTSREELFRIPVQSEYQSMFANRYSFEEAAIELDRSGGPTNTLIIEILFDNYHEDASWKVTSVDGGTVYASKGPNAYRYGASATEEVELTPGQYLFTINDRRGTDEFRAIKSYNLYSQGDAFYNSGRKTIFEMGEYDIFEGESQSHLFEIVADVPDSQPSIVIDESQALNLALEQESLVMCTSCDNFCTTSGECCSGLCSGNRCHGSDCSKSSRLGSSSKNRQKARIQGRAGGSSRNYD